MQYFCNQSRNNMLRVERAFLYCQITASFLTASNINIVENGFFSLSLDSFKNISSVRLSINKLQNAFCVPRSYCRLSKVKKWSLFYTETFRVSPPISSFYRDYGCIFAFNKRKKIVFKVAEKKKETLEDLFITDDSHVWYCLLELF